MTTTEQLTAKMNEPAWQHALRQRDSTFLGVVSADQVERGGDLYKQVLSGAVKPRRGGYCLISNYSRMSQAGTHWVGMAHLLDPDHPPVFFDSFGFAPDRDDAILNLKTDFVPFLQAATLSHHLLPRNGEAYRVTSPYAVKRNATGRGWLWSPYMLQAFTGPNSNTCGEWCCFFLRHGPPLRRTSMTQVSGLPRLVGGWGWFVDVRKHGFRDEPSRSTALAVPPTVQRLADLNDFLVRKNVGIVSVDRLAPS